MLRLLAACLAVSLLITACSDGDSSGNAGTSSGSVVITVLADGPLAAAVTSATVASEPAGITTHFANLAAGQESRELRNLAPGEHTFTATGYAAGNDVIGEASVSASVARGHTSAVVLNLQPAGAFTVSGITASSASPLTGETVTLTATIAQAADYPVTYAWSDDCRGEFEDAAAQAARWSNRWQENCTLTLSAASRAGTGTLSIRVATRYAKGTVITIAGASCPILEMPHPLQGEGGPAAQAYFGRPNGVAVAKNGDVYFSDSDGGRLLMVGNDGILRRIAGIQAGSVSSGGDGGPATTATMYNPFQISLDADENIYVAESWGYRVRKIHRASGKIFTVAGNGTVGYPAYMANASSTSVRPLAQTFDPQGNMYIAAGWDARLYKVFAQGNTIVTLAFDLALYDLHYGADGKLYAAAANVHQIKKIDPVSGYVQNFAGTGALGYAGENTFATQAKFNKPYAVKRRPDGTVYVADTLNQVIRAIDPAGKIRTVIGPNLNTLPGDGGVLARPMTKPAALDFDAAGNMYVADQDACQVKKVVGPW